MSNSPYDDVPLTKDAESIRLLELLDNDFTGPIRCRHHVVDLEEASNVESYNALSYAWGDLEATEEIELNGCPYRIRPNLYSFLVLYLENRVKDRLVSNKRRPSVASIASKPHAWAVQPFLWIDALCIDQHNDAERSHQVSLMGAIFRGAYSVLAWLSTNSGVPTPPAIAAMVKVVPPEIGSVFPKMTEENAQSCWTVDSRHACKSLSDYRTCLKYLEVLYNNPYWQRMWVLQEFALAQRVNIYVGDIIFRYHDLKKIQNEIRDFECDNPLIWAYSRPKIHRLLASPGYHFISRAPRHYMRSSFREDRHSPLDRLLHFTADLKCRNPHDKVYALLGLSRTSIVVDYSQSNEQLFTQVLIHMRASMQSHQAFYPGQHSGTDAEAQEKRRTNAYRGIAALLKDLPLDMNAYVRESLDSEPLRLRDVEPYATYLQFIESSASSKRVLRDLKITGACFSQLSLDSRSGSIG